MTDPGAIASSRRFPQGFLWGAATSAYQVEGGAERRGEVVWDAFLADGGGFRGDVGTTSADHIRHLDGDLDLIAELGLTAYRFSISWARVMPDARTPTPSGLDFYERLVDGLLARGVTPLATLAHLDTPMALGAGGWAERSTAEWFAAYAAYVAERLGDRVRLWATVNEPLVESLLGHYDGSWPPRERDPARTVASLHHKLLGHAWASQAIKSHVCDASTGIVNSYSPGIPAEDRDEHRAAVRRVDAFTNHYLLDPLFLGSYPAEAAEYYERHGACDAVRSDDLAAISGTADFLGLNYYSRRRLADRSALADVALADRAAADGAPSNGAAEIGYTMGLLDDLGVAELAAAPGVETSAIGWGVEPSGLRDALVAVTERYGSIPVYVTENGLALHDYTTPEGTINDERRVDYLDRHISAIADAIAEGADIRGYFTWSLMDNLEWNLGYAPRFGLIYVDLPTGTRYPKRSFGWYRDFIAAQRPALSEELVS